jgi:hypothetical protein
VKADRAGFKNTVTVMSGFSSAPSTDSTWTGEGETLMESGAGSLPVHPQTKRETNPKMTATAMNPRTFITQSTLLFSQTKYLPMIILVPHCVDYLPIPGYPTNPTGITSGDVTFHHLNTVQ